MKGQDSMIPTFFSSKKLHDPKENIYFSQWIRSYPKVILTKNKNSFQERGSQPIIFSSTKNYVIIVSSPQACSISSSLSPIFFFIRSTCLFQDPPTDSLLGQRNNTIHQNNTKAIMYLYRLCTAQRHPTKVASGGCKQCAFVWMHPPESSQAFY